MQADAGRVHEVLAERNEPGVVGEVTETGHHTIDEPSTGVVRKALFEIPVPLERAARQREDGSEATIERAIAEFTEIVEHVHRPERRRHEDVQWAALGGTAYLPDVERRSLRGRRSVRVRIRRSRRVRRKQEGCRRFKDVLRRSTGLLGLQRSL
jgi:hypothetical protein